MPFITLPPEPTATTLAPVRLLLVIAVSSLLLASCDPSPESVVSPPTSPPVATPPREKDKKATEAPEPAPVSPGTITSIGLEKLFELQQSGQALIYDVRPAVIHAFGTIPGAINWPKSSFASQLPQREKEIRRAANSGKVVVLYCTDADCPDSRSVASQLAGRGHDVSVFVGGYAMWKESGL